MTPTARRFPRLGPRALLRWAASCLVVLGLGGCALGLVYPRLDTVVGFYLQGLVSLDDAQSEQLKPTLAGNLEWHKRSELARYAAFLRDVAAVVDGGTGRNDWLEASRAPSSISQDLRAGGARLHGARRHVHRRPGRRAAREPRSGG